MTTERAALWMGESPFGRDLGVKVESVESESVRLFFPHDERHGAGRALRASASGKSGMHGGAIASMVSLASQAGARAGTGHWDTRTSTVSMHIGYVRSARSSLTVETRAVRRVRELIFLETTLTGEDGALVAEGSSVVRLGTAEDTKAVGAQAIVPAIGPGTDDGVLRVFQSAIRAIPFVAQREVDIAGAAPGRVDLIMSAAPTNLDRDGTVHEGAALTLLDMAGASTPFTVATARSNGATVALSAHFVSPLPSDGLIARATVRAADASTCWSDVALLGRTGDTLHAYGTVVYRFGD